MFSTLLIVTDLTMDPTRVPACVQSENGRIWPQLPRKTRSDKKLQTATLSGGDRGWVATQRTMNKENGAIRPKAAS